MSKNRMNSQSCQLSNPQESGSLLHQHIQTNKSTTATKEEKTAFMATETTSVPPNQQRGVSVFSSRRVLMVRLYERHSCLCSNGLVRVKPEIPVKILIASFAGIPRKIGKGQVVGTVLSHSTKEFLSTLNSTEARAFADV